MCATLRACSHPFESGDFHNISYPFWGCPLSSYCGLPEFQLVCQDGFPVLHIIYAPDFGNLTLFYGCSSVTPALASNTFSCRHNDSSTETSFYTIGSIPTGENNRTCNESITVPVLQTAAKSLRDNVSSLTEALDDGFEVQWRSYSTFGML
ncbi:hypothetical protein FH972_007904 [Carpinus fangiana]|uniref:non-specific serine/threonine protein kinase n=1 Tax=Carpinus fangiana TaxID=176857 RepID=A0A5N6QYM7_9ROSI|nr:hypothetical protein FH972_007904 [Carpinus fangiana]